MSADKQAGLRRWWNTRARSLLCGREKERERRSEKEREEERKAHHMRQSSSIGRDGRKEQGPHFGGWRPRQEKPRNERLSTCCPGPHGESVRVD